MIVKDEKKFAMVQKLRELARIVQAFPGTTNEDRSLLGLTVPSERQDQPAPAFAPKLDVVKVNRNLVSVQLRDSQNLSRLRPDFAKSATVFSFIGDTPPTTADGWFFQGGTTKARFDLSFDPSLPMPACPHSRAASGLAWQRPRARPRNSSISSTVRCRPW